MNKIYLLLTILILASCTKIEFVEENVKGVVSKKEFKPAEDVYEYYYGFSILSGDFCYHYGLNHHDEEYSTIVCVAKRDIKSYQVDIYNKYNLADSVSMVKITQLNAKTKEVLNISYDIKE